MDFRLLLRGMTEREEVKAMGSVSGLRGSRLGRDPSGALVLSAVEWIKDDNAFQALLHGFIVQRASDIVQLRNSDENPPMSPFAKVGISEGEFQCRNEGRREDGCSIKAVGHGGARAPTF
jgi:hypothetical protein